jgi:hypothetical protein
MNPLALALAEAGGVAAPPELTARLRDLVAAELTRGEAELRASRTGYGDPIAVVFAPGEAGVGTSYAALTSRGGAGGSGPSVGVVAALPLPAGARADAGVAPERSWLVAAGAIGALVDVTGASPPRAAGDLALQAGRLGEHLVLAFPLAGGGGA